MAKIGIICAVERELAAFLPLITDIKKTSKAMLTIYEGNINGVDVAALLCGVCKTNAALATQILIDTFRVSTVINAGTAGGMNPELDILDTVVATKVIHHDMEEDVLTDYHPWMESPFINSDERLLNLARGIENPFNGQHKIFFGIMATGERFIDKQGREEINSKYAPLSVDMETASIAHVCYVNKIPFISIRTITDTPKYSGELNFEKNCIMASQISKKIVLNLLENI